MWCAATPPASLVSAAPALQGWRLDANVQSKIDTDVRALLRAGHVDGATIAIVEGGTVVYARGYGLRDLAKRLPADTETRYEIGSVTKQFTAAAILQLKAAGKIDLDATVVTYLPTVPHAAEITVRQLLTHTTGLDDYVGIPNFETLAGTPATSDDIMARISAKPLAFTPGTRFAYSSTNYLILGRIVEVVTDQRWEDYLQHHLFEPAGMTHSATIAQEGRLADMARGYVYAQGHTAASKPIAESWAFSAGDIVSTAGDLAKWGEALSSGRILSPSDYELLTSPARLADGSRSGYGFGIKIDRFDGQPRIWHDGNTNGFDASDQFFPSQGTRIIVLTNAADGGSDRIAERIYDDLYPNLAAAARQAEEASAIASATAASAGAHDASAAVPPTSAEQRYFGALAVMHAIPNAPFWRFGYHFGQVATGIPDRQADVQVVTRTEDGQVRYQDDRGVPVRPGFPFMYIRPDLLLKPVAATPRDFGISADSPYTVIGSTSTHTTHYTVTDASGETAADCPGATHLRLRPKAGADPFHYNLRELWITPASGRVCEAIAVWNAGVYYGHRFSVAFVLHVAPETGLIDRWFSTGVARSGPFSSSYRMDGRYTNVRAEQSAPTGLFDR
jgi:CubicO group peptidase (beta-lactamase class C family)